MAFVSPQSHHRPAAPFWEQMTTGEIIGSIGIWFYFAAAACMWLAKIVLILVVPSCLRTAFPISSTRRPQKGGSILDSVHQRLLTRIRRVRQGNNNIVKRTHISVLDKPHIEVAPALFSRTRRATKPLLISWLQLRIFSAFVKQASKDRSHRFKKQ